MVSLEQVRQLTYRVSGMEVARHLFRVAAGLDSLVLGEPQILGQVADAYTLALNQRSTGPVLSRLFQAAIHVGKRARHETRIGHNPSTVSSVAVHLAVSVFGDLSAARIVVIGAGEMANLAIDAMHKRGARSIAVVNRTLDLAREVASRWSAVAFPFESLPAILRQADIVLSCTGAAHTVLHVDTLTAATAGRSGRPLLLFDIAVPRDIDPEVGQLPGVRLYNIDQLVDAVDATLGERQREIPRAERLIEEEVASFQAWFDGLALQDLIAALHRKAESIRARELARSLRRLPSLTSNEQARLEGFSRSLVRKLLHDPIMSLRQQSLDSSAAVYAEVARELFALPEHGSRPEEESPSDGGAG